MENCPVEPVEACVPVRTPTRLRAIPGGTCPAITVQIIGALPPVEVNVWLYCEPNKAPGNAPEGEVITKGAATRMLSVTDATCAGLAESCHRAVNEYASVAPRK